MHYTNGFSILLVLVFLSGCGGRTIGSQNGDSDGSLPQADVQVPEAGPAPNDGEVFSCAAQDARSGELACGLLLGYAWNGSSCEAVSCTCEGTDCDALFQSYEACHTTYAPECLTVDECVAQEIYGCADPCDMLAGWYWDGSFCQGIQCCCEGPDCDAVYTSREACNMAHTMCATNACGQVGGYCDYGDLMQPVCAQGYGVDSWITWHWQHEEVCGLGVCCAPCPDETDPEVWYLSHEPDGCADIDWSCLDENLRGFDNECGCGCAPSRRRRQRQRQRRGRLSGSRL